MRRSLSGCFLVLLLFYGAAFAQEAESLDEAKNLANSSGKPILMEFLRPG